jgi:hypothetical protein
MANTIYIKTSSKNAQPTKRFTRNPTILLTTIFALFLVSAQAKTTGQNEKFNSNPFPNPKTLMKLTTNTAASVSTVVSTASTYTALLSNAVTSSHTTSVAASVAMPNEPLAQRRQSVAWFAASYSDWGYKYQSGSSSIENGGFDCSGFVMPSNTPKADKCRWRKLKRVTWFSSVEKAAFPTWQWLFLTTKKVWLSFTAQTQKASHKKIFQIQNIGRQN